MVLLTFIYIYYTRHYHERFHIRRKPFNGMISIQRTGLFDAVVFAIQTIRDNLY